ncbi:MAG: InlB B-repeat-containing protein [Butyrivibrio sp.]|nr:InlB B-repeat-containing protein [Acetatifactor muris]MCM1559724.1 InlB B-repeat-containing protein [Butyrivibrio sp.]
MKRGILAALLTVLSTVLLLGAEPVSAAPVKTIYSSPYVSFSPDGLAWTTNSGDRSIQWYQKGMTVNTGISSALRKPEEGEHYYYRQAEESVPVGRWVVEHTAGQCIHAEYPSDYHGISYGRRHCETGHYSGWRAYCADCGEVISDLFVYMSREAAETIDYIPMGMDYYYLCPFCSNLEQGREFRHMCKAVSANMYRVIYDANFPADAENPTGYMAHSLHMYGDAEEYEGIKLTPVRELSLNTYGCTGYRFVGWNTMPDGSGETYEDGAVIKNLTSENWNGRSGRNEKGTVILYACWEPVESTLLIDSAGGAYAGRSGITRVTKRYGETYTPDASLLEPPEGYTIEFQVNGGEAVSPVKANLYFLEWAMTQPFSGLFKNGIYRYTASEGNRDTLQAVYGTESIVLPRPEREGYSFGGWYYDAAFRLPAGSAGDSVTPGRNMTLYAQWVDLTLKAADNYRAYGGSGAVDLSWQMQDGQGKTYLLYQSTDGKDWVQVSAADDVCNVPDIHMASEKTGKTEKYTVPYTGIYTISLSGAQGGSYKDSEGGRGGSAEVRIWLEKGEVLTFEVGGADGYNGGGKGSVYGCGGGCTVVSSDKKGVIAVAGGGGGASESGDGGVGGSSAFLGEAGYAGEDGMAGGGGGFRGGAAGEYVAHAHTPACYREISGTISAGSDFYNAYDTECSGVYGKSMTVSGLSVRAYAHSSTKQPSINLTVGNKNTCLETPYAGTLTFSDTTINSLYDVWGVGANSTLTKITVFFLHEDGRITSETVMPEQLGNTLSVTTDVWYSQGPYRAERPVYTRNVSQKRFSGSIETRPGASCEYPAGAFHGTTEWYRLDGTFVFEVEEDVTGVYIEAARSIPMGNVNCWMSIGVQNVQYRYDGRELQCGYEEGQIESALPAYGGSSYVNTEVVLDYTLTPGDREGDGCAGLEAVQLGFWEEQALENVKAPDLAAPCAVSVETAEMLPAGKDRVSVSWKKPKDNGTIYYHRAEAYLKGATSLLCTSNITQNILTSGVAGYYYVVNGEKSFVADSTGSYTGTENVEVSTAEGMRYLHLAAVDGAGNISETVHIPISAESVPWKIATRQLQIREGENVYAAGEKTYYVRCDGVTPFLLEHGACMEGPASENNRLAYSIFKSPLYGQNIIYVPGGGKQGEPLYFTEGAPLLTPYPYFTAEYTDEERSLAVEQMFTLGMEAHGQQVEILPGAGGTYREKGMQKTYYSDPVSDADNGMILVGDGEGPVINGLEALSDGQLIDRQEEAVRLYLTAGDDLSGVAEFYLKVTNLDNHNTKIYYSEGNVIELEITKEEPLFTGEFTVTAHAADHVGNVTELSRQVTEFGLETEIKRILTPHDPLFKGGESGILYITAYGYADRVEVEFPPEFTAADERLKKLVFDYSGAQLYRQEQAVQFMVPLYIPTDREYTLKVRAFRGDECLESSPVLYVTSEGGEIVSEFRTRLR